MDTSPPPAPAPLPPPQPAPERKQRSPWFYALLGCGALAGLICLGFGIFFAVVGSAFSSVNEGLVDADARRKNAVAQLGAIPEGYEVAMSFSMFGLVKTTVLTDAPLLPDGGFEPKSGTHLFVYMRRVGDSNTERAKAYVKGSEADARALQLSGINVDSTNVLKRGQLTLPSGTVHYLSARGRLDTGSGLAQDGINTVVLFDCPTDQLQLGVWTQPDPQPEVDNETLDLSGTVADDAELSRFLGPLSPCGK